MLIFRIAAIICLACVVQSPLAAQPVASDTAAIVEFQRALDAYAFQHRQVERRLGASSDQRAMAEAMRAMRPSATDGDVITPLIAAALRERIRHAARSGCRFEPARGSFEVPRPNQPASGLASMPACLAAVLPRLPDELEYRAVGAVLVLVDSHANLVIDVLHGAFAPPADN